MGSQAATIVFLGLQIALFLIRRVPVGKAEGWAPRAAALVGSNLLLVLLNLPLALAGGVLAIWLSGLFGSSGYFGGPTANLTKTIFDFSQQPYPHLIQLAWGGALLIIVAVLGVNVVTRLLFQRGKEW